MKPITFLLLAAINFSNIYSQNIDDEVSAINLNNFKQMLQPTAAINDLNLISYRVHLTKTTHIISPEPILYVDISSPNVEGDLPEKNIFRLKPLPGKLESGENFNVTIVTKNFVSVYQLICVDSNSVGPASYLITIDPQEAIQLNTNKISEADFHKLSIMVLSKKREIKTIKNQQYGIKFWINNIFICGDYLLFDIGLKNKTNLPLAIDEIRFKLLDSKRVKAHISQDNELKPVYSYYDNSDLNITGTWRNFYIFPKFTYPTEKILSIELTEQQISGRRVDLKINYNEVLNAKFLN